MKNLYRMQKIELEQAKLRSDELVIIDYKELRNIKGDFNDKKDDYLKDKARLEQFTEKLQKLSSEDSNLRARIAAEEKELYGGKITSSKAANAKEQQIVSLKNKLNKCVTDAENQRQARTDFELSLEDKLRQLSEIQAVFAAKKLLYQQGDQRRAEQIAVLEKERQKLLRRVSSQLLGWYQGTNNRFGGAPLARLNNKNVCTGCNTIVTPALARKVANAGDIIVCCEKCGRRLFIDEQ